MVAVRPCTVGDGRSSWAGWPLGRLAAHSAGTCDLKVQGQGCCSLVCPAEPGQAQLSGGGVDGEGMEPEVVRGELSTKTLVMASPTALKIHVCAVSLKMKLP